MDNKTNVGGVLLHMSHNEQFTYNLAVWKPSVREVDVMEKIPAILSTYNLPCSCLECVEP